MRIIKTDVKADDFKKSDNLGILEEFINGGMDCVEIVDYTQASAYSCTGSLNTSIKRYGYHGVKAKVLNGRAYLVKD